MIAGKAAGLIHDLAEYSEKTAVAKGKPILPNLDIHMLYQPLIQRYIEMEKQLEHYYSS
jgi:hypothetical protein